MFKLTRLLESGQRFWSIGNRYSFHLQYVRWV